MSATKFKVGDKVRVRKDLKVNHWYGECLFTSFMASLADEIGIVTGVCNNGDGYLLDHYDVSWTDEMLEPAEKTLDNLCRGDMIRDSHDDTRKILAALDGCYLLNYGGIEDATGDWYTVAELKKLDYQVFDPNSPKATIEINGKKYDRAEVEEAIKDLETIE
jgi:hypothetical protein